MVSIGILVAEHYATQQGIDDIGDGKSGKKTNAQREHARSCVGVNCSL
jgi:hypothetical protein